MSQKIEIPPAIYLNAGSGITAGHDPEQTTYSVFPYGRTSRMFTFSSGLAH